MYRRKCTNLIHVSHSGTWGEWGVRGGDVHPTSASGSRVRARPRTSLHISSPSRIIGGRSKIRPCRNFDYRRYVGITQRIKIFHENREMSRYLWRGVKFLLFTTLFQSKDDVDTASQTVFHCSCFFEVELSFSMFETLDTVFRRETQHRRYASRTLRDTTPIHGDNFQ